VSAALSDLLESLLDAREDPETRRLRLEAEANGGTVMTPDGRWIVFCRAPREHREKWPAGGIVLRWPEDIPN